MGKPICSDCGMNMGKIAYVNDSHVTDQDGRKVREVSGGKFGGFFACVNSNCPSCYLSHKKSRIADLESKQNEK